MPSHKKLYLFLLLSLLFSACKNTKTPLAAQTHHYICGRNGINSLERPKIYQTWTPNYWIRHDPLENESITDTKRSICEFLIEDGIEKIRITVHTFPFEDEKNRIPAQAQIGRWKRQFQELDFLSTRVLAESHSGFSGLLFEGEGLIDDKRTGVLGWSMQLASIYIRSINLQEDSLAPYKLADYTIKASGPPALLAKHRLDIIKFAHQFELIDELPFPM